MLFQSSTISIRPGENRTATITQGPISTLRELDFYIYNRIAEHNMNDAKAYDLIRTSICPNGVDSDLTGKAVRQIYTLFADFVQWRGKDDIDARFMFMLWKAERKDFIEEVLTSTHPEMFGNMRPEDRLAKCGYDIRQLHPLFLKFEDEAPGYIGKMFTDGAKKIGNFICDFLPINSTIDAYNEQSEKTLAALIISWSVIITPETFPAGISRRIATTGATEALPAICKSIAREVAYDIQTQVKLFVARHGINIGKRQMEDITSEVMRDLRKYISTKGADARIFKETGLELSEDFLRLAEERTIRALNAVAAQKTAPAAKPLALELADEFQALFVNSGGRSIRAGAFLHSKCKTIPELKALEKELRLINKQGRSRTQLLERLKNLGILQDKMASGHRKIHIKLANGFDLPYELSSENLSTKNIEDLASILTMAGYKAEEILKILAK